MVTIDMAGDMQDLMNYYNQLKSNPMQLLSRKFNIPQNVDINNPNDIIQHLLNTGQVSQQQVNNAMKMKHMFRG
jgi:hypothetical protein